MVFETGPYVKVALFCEKILREVDGVMSIIRVIDRVTITAQGQNAPATMPKTPYTLTAVISLVPGASRGRHELKIVKEDPSGLDTGPDFSTSVNMEGEDRAVNIVANMHFMLELEGLYLFKVSLDGMLITKMPFRVIYARISTSTVRPMLPPEET
jgi:hypothetical protein